MLKHRVFAGTLLAAAIGAVLVADGFLAPAYPCLLVCALLAGGMATRELVALLPPDGRPSLALCTAGVLAVLLANWAPAVSVLESSPLAPRVVVAEGTKEPASNIGDVRPLAERADHSPDTWMPVAVTFGATVIAAFLVEMARYREPGAGAVPRVAYTVFVVAYLGVLPSFFLKLRWADPAWSGLALTLTIFVPKVGDIGAYFTGRLLGKHPFSPRLSPKKTWEGFAGGLAAAVLTAVGLAAAGPVFRHGVPEAVGFGLAVGLAGVLGDLAESLVKRDGLAKDAARSIPGFGGLLDVIDSVLFAGPVAYLWLARGFW